MSLHATAIECVSCQRSVLVFQMCFHDVSELREEIDWIVVQVDSYKNSDDVGKDDFQGSEGDMGEI